MSHADTDDIEPTMTYSLPSGAVLERYDPDDGPVYCIKQNPKTHVERVWLAPSDLDAVFGEVSSDV
jgi:hypothetical protein